MRSFGRRIGGGCLCGAIRYSIGGYDHAVHCHCAQCRRSSGAAFLTWVCVPLGRFRWESEPPPAYGSSPAVRRSYCPACGSPLVMTYAGEAEISVTLGSLDRPDLIGVDANIFASERLPLLHGFDRDLPQHDGFDGSSAPAEVCRRDPVRTRVDPAPTQPAHR